jgi:chromosome segregation ATPase
LELASAKSKETELVGRALRAEAMIIHLKANLAATQTELYFAHRELKTKETELATAKSELATAKSVLAIKETKLTTCTSSLILIQREHRDAHQMRVRMTNERDTARSEAARAKRELVATTSERDAAKECKAKSPNYKAPVNDECNPKNCDEWDCGQWCVCYNADHDATYEALGCAADDEDMCQCD